MILYKWGKIVSKGKNYVLFEQNLIGYIVYVTYPNNYEENTEIKLFISHIKTETNDILYGFKVFAERLLFSDLMQVNGIGPKTAMTILRQGKDKVISMITSGDASNLAKLPWIGARTATQIVLELKDKYISLGYANNKQMISPNDIITTLKSLGFKSHQIDSAIDQLDLSSNIEDAIQDAIKIISHANSTQTK